jgi:hypothetical protein
MFVNGRDTISQEEAVALATALGWSITHLGRLASKDDRRVVLPPSSPRYSQQTTREIVRALHPEAFVSPGPGPAGSPELAFLLHQAHVIGMPLVGVGRWGGPRVPRVREPACGAPDPVELDEDVAYVAEQRWPWAQRWYPPSVTADNCDDTIRRTELWSPKTRRGKAAEKWRPCQHKAACMGASSMQRLNGWTSKEIARFLDVADAIGPVPDLTAGTDARTVRKAVKRGDVLWSLQGAWPWAAFELEGVPYSWWDSGEPWRVLHDAAGRLDRGGAMARSLSNWI